MANALELSNLEQQLNNSANENETTISNPSGNQNQTIIMATEDNPKVKYKRLDKQRTHKEHTVSIFHQHIITASHGAILLYTFLIIYYCFSGEFQFFTWHPLLLSIGWMFLMSEALLIMSKDNIITGTLPKWLRVRLHWIFQLIGLVLIGAGFAVAYINKDNLKKEHFKSWHALFGLIGIISFIPALLDGVLALYHGALRHYISPRYNKFLHFFNGVVAYSFGGAALILSVYTKWFSRHSEGNILSFWLGLLLVTVAVAGTLVRPAISTLNIAKKFFGKD